MTSVRAGKCFFTQLFPARIRHLASGNAPVTTSAILRDLTNCPDPLALELYASIFKLTFWFGTLVLLAFSRPRILQFLVEKKRGSECAALRASFKGPSVYLSVALAAKVQLRLRAAPSNNCIDSMLSTGRPDSAAIFLAWSS